MSDPFAFLDDHAVDRLEAADVPEWTDPMLATLVDEPFSDPEWIFERKLDGERCLAFRSGDVLRLRSRNRTDLAATYPEVHEALTAQRQRRFVVDGEIVAFDGRRTSFSRLQQRMQLSDPGEARRSGIDVYYYLFDVLHLAGRDTTSLPQRDRKTLLRRAFRFADPIRFTPHRNRDGREFHDDACRRGWEGLIAKDASAPYVHARSRKWQKLKCVHRQELVVGGFTEPEGTRVGFGAILVGFHGDDGALVYAGKVGTGFDDRTLGTLGDRMRSLETESPPFDRGRPPGDGVHWIEPRLVAEIGFTEWTKAGKLRHPRFVGLRRDKDPADVVREMPS